MALTLTQQAREIANNANLSIEERRREVKAIASQVKSETGRSAAPEVECYLEQLAMEGDAPTSQQGLPRDTSTGSDEVTPIGASQEHREALMLAQGATISGGMIAMYPLPSVAETLAVPGGEHPSKLHVTLKFLGPDATLLSSVFKGQVIDAVREATRDQRWFVATTGESTTFAKNDKGLVPVVQLLDVPSLREFRTKLLSLLPLETMPDTYSTFLPHMTLAYVEPGKESTIAVNPAGLPILFPDVCVVYAADRHTYYLGGQNAG